MQASQRQIVIDAINSLSRRVTAADVALKTGLPLNVANSVLNQVAADTGGHLQVSTTGDVVYKFAGGFETKYLATGLIKVFQTCAEKIFQVAFFLLRISFGIMLVLSFLAIIVLIIIAVIAMSKIGSDNDDGIDLGGSSFNFFDYMLLRDLLFWGTWSSPDPYIDYNNPYSRKPQKKSNFLFNVFSFLFGDGNPNNHLEERKWQLIAETIRANQGVVTAEQLAPFTGADPKNEDGVLPVLVRFDGKPEVTESGSIMYVFPNMQVHAASSQGHAGATHLREYQWPFTNADAGALTPVYLLATFNFFGSWWLTFYTAHVLPSLHPLITALTIYGTAFVAVPLIRFMILQLLNKAIDERNSKRQSFAIMLQNGNPELNKKLEEARDLKIKERVVTTSNVAYTTEKDSLEQKDFLDDQFEKLEETKETKTRSMRDSPRKPSAAPHANITDRSHSANDGNIIDLSERQSAKQELRGAKPDSERDQSLPD